MCNCGKKRSVYRSAPVTVNNNINATQRMQSQPLSQNDGSVLFEYTGNSALSVTGIVTRKNYRFQFTGDRRYIDVKDADGMMRISVLKRID